MFLKKKKKKLFCVNKRGKKKILQRIERAFWKADEKGSLFGLFENLRDIKYGHTHDFCADWINLGQVQKAIKIKIWKDS